MSVASEVLVVRTGTANLASVLAAFERLGATPRLTEDPDAVASGARVVLPGVGAFAAAGERLATLGLVEPLRERVLSLRPTLAICLGLQLLGEGSEESPGARGLAVVPFVARRFAGQVRVPQLGWNRVVPDPRAQLVREGFAYFANSYRWPVEADAARDGWSCSAADHGGAFVAAIERGSVLACQFHPELSGAWGAALLRRWWEASC